MRNFINHLLIAAALSLAGCQAPSDLSSEPPAGSAPPFIQYDCLYDCVWTVTDTAEESDAIPALFADVQGALCFEQGSGDIFMLRRRADLDMSAGSGEAYSILAEGVYSLDRETGTVRVSSGETQCYFRIERLNDRTMTLYYRSDPNSYVAYTRCELDSVTVVK